MSDERTLFESDSQENVENVARFLHQLADAMVQRDKQVQLRKGEDTFTFFVPAVVSFEVEFEEEETDEGLARELEIEIGWLEPAAPAGEEEE